MKCHNPQNILLAGLVLAFTYPPKGSVGQTNVQLVDTTWTTSISTGPDGRAFATTRNGGVLVSTNNGASWVVASPDSANASSVTVCSDGTVFAARNSKIYMSVDDGLSWDAIDVLTRYDSDIACLPNSDVLVGGPGPTLRVVRYNQSEVTVETVGTVNRNIVGAWHIGRSTDSTVFAGVAACMELICGALFESTNGGISFGPDTTWNDWPAMAMASTETGIDYVDSWDGAFRRERDSTSWAFVWPSPYAERIVPLGGDSLFAVSSTGAHVSPDAGLTWAPVGLPEGIVSVVDVACNPDCTILLIATGQGIVRILGQVPTSTEKTSVSQDALGPSLTVFPNPFVSTLSIDLDAFSCEPDLEVFDILGRRIKRINPFMRAGDRQIELPTAGLTAGAYIFRACCDGLQCAESIAIKAAD